MKNCDNNFDEFGIASPDEWEKGSSAVSEANNAECGEMTKRATATENGNEQKTFPGGKMYGDGLQKEKAENAEVPYGAPFDAESSKDPVSAPNTADDNREVPTTVKQNKTPFRALLGALKGKKYLGFCFLVPLLLLFAVYSSMGVFPFGQNSVLVLDLNGQYIYFFEELRSILHGDGSFLYSFGRALGGEFMGIFAYYLASPLSFIVALFPKDMITEAIYLLILLKCGLCGLTFGIYVHKKRPRQPIAAITFSTVWALCSFAVVMQHNLMWTDCMILLPLVMLGVDALIEKGRLPLLVVSLSLCVLSNFYIGYMMCIFAVVWFFFRYFAEDRRRLGAHLPKSLLRGLIAAVCVLCISGVIILPTYYSLSFGKTTFSTPTYNLTQKFDIADLVTKIFFGSYDTVRPEGLPFLFTSTSTLLLVPVWFFSKRVAVREKIASGLLILFFLLSMDASVLDLIWHGMQVPNWLNYRYAFMLCFFLVWIAFRGLEELEAANFKTVILSAAFFGVLLIILQKLDYDNMPDLTCVWATLGFLTAYLLILKGVTSKSPSVKVTACIVLAIAVGFEMFSSSLENFYALDRDVVFSSRTGYRSYIDKYEDAVTAVTDLDSSFYRMEKTVHRKTNDNMALGMNGLSGSTSTLNKETVTFLNRMGFASKSHWSKYLGATPVSDSILGVKYILDGDGSLEDGIYSEILRDDENGIVTYENSYALPIAFGANGAFASLDFSDDDALPSPIEKMNALVKDLTGDTEDVFAPIDHTVSSKVNVTETEASKHIKYSRQNKDLDSSVTFTFTAPDDGIIYCHFPSDYMREVKLFANGESLGTYFANETYRVVKVGRFEPGETVNVKMVLNKDEVYLVDCDCYFWSLDEDVFKASMETLSTAPYEIENYSSSSFSGRMTVTDETSQVFTSIPYDEGWQITVDGKKIEYEKALDALITFKLEAGEHEIEMRYSPVCVKEGLFLSACGVTAFALFETADAITRKKKKAPRADGKETS